MIEVVRLKTLLKDGSSFKQFDEGLELSSFQNQKQLLNLVLVQLVQLKKNDFSQYLHALLRFGADPNYTETKGTSETTVTQRSILMIACEKSNNQVVEQLLKIQQVDALALDNNNQNILFYALKNTHEESAFLISRTIIQQFPLLINSSMQTKTNLTVLAAKRKSTKILDLLLRNNLDPNSEDKESGNTALHVILENYNKDNDRITKEMILMLLKYGAKTEIKNKMGESCEQLAEKIGFDLKQLQIQNENNDEEYKDNESQYYSQNAATKDEDIFSRNTDEVFKEDFEFSSDEEEQPCNQEIDFGLLQKEILSFMEINQKQIQKAWEDIQSLYWSLYELGTRLNLSIHIIGSFATELWTPESDIDIVYVNKNGEHYAVNKILAEIYHVLKENSSQYGIEKIYLNSDLKFPNISIILSPTLNKRKLDIAVFQYRNNGEKYVNFIKKQLDRNPYIKPLFYVFRRLLKGFKLSNPSRGGIKTYASFLMLKQLEKCPYPSYNLGQAFINFIFYYAYCFPYQQVLDENSQYTIKLSLIDPINKTNNVGGRNTETEHLRNMFKTLDYGLRLKVKNTEGKILPYLFELYKIFK